MASKTLRADSTPFPNHRRRDRVARIAARQKTTLPITRVPWDGLPALALNGKGGQAAHGTLRSFAMPGSIIVAQLRATACATEPLFVQAAKTIDDVGMFGRVIAGFAQVAGQVRQEQPLVGFGETRRATGSLVSRTLPMSFHAVATAHCAAGPRRPANEPPRAALARRPRRSPATRLLPSRSGSTSFTPAKFGQGRHPVAAVGQLAADCPSGR